MKRVVAIAALLLSPVIVAQVRRRTVAVPGIRNVTLTPSKDNTLFQTTDGSISNGTGPRLFAGATATNSFRRALLAFDVASHIPPGSQIRRVVLTLTVSMATSGSQPMSIHRLSADWGEGASFVARGGFIFGGGDGKGAPAKPGDATWLHTFLPDKRWTSPGGDFDAAPDATFTTGSAEYRWESPAMVARVQQWLDQPSTNFGWIVVGNESTSRTAKGFNSRESGGSSAPALMIEFDPPR